MEYPTCIQSLKQKEFLLQLAQEKSSYFNRKYRLIRLFYFQKYRNFIGSRCCPNLTKLSMEYPTCIQSLKQKEFLLQLVQEKSSYFNRKYLTYSLILFSKIQKFYRIKELSKCNQTRYGVSHLYLESKIERIFAIACLGKKFVFQSEIQTYSLILFSKIQKFYRIKELSKSNQTRYGVSHVYLESKTKRIFAIACLGKKFVFQSEIFDLFAYSIFKNIEILSDQGVVQIVTKLGMEYPTCIQSLKQKKFLLQLAQEKSSFFNRSIDLFAYSIFKNIEILSDQGVVQI